MKSLSVLSTVRKSIVEIEVERHQMRISEKNKLILSNKGCPRRGPYNLEHSAQPVPHVGSCLVIANSVGANLGVAASVGVVIGIGSMLPNSQSNKHLPRGNH